MNGADLAPGLPGADSWERPPRVAVLVKQIPGADDHSLDATGRLDRTGPGEMNAYCRRAVAKGVELARSGAGHCTLYTLGPPSAAEVLCEGIAFGADSAVLVSDPAFAGSDTLATARALAAILEADGPFDLILAGRNSLDADTGQVPPQVAELLDLPFVTAARWIRIEGGSAQVVSELDGGWRRLRVALPAVVSVAERITDPCKMPAAARLAVDGSRLRLVCADDLGPGPWGEAASPTRVGPVRLHEVVRRRNVLAGAPAAQAAQAVSLLGAWGALPGAHGDAASGAPVADPVPGPSGIRREGSTHPTGPIAVLIEPAREQQARELLGEAARLAAAAGTEVTALGPGPMPAVFSRWGADRAVVVRRGLVEEDFATAVSSWCRGAAPSLLLGPATLWGREIVGRVAAAAGAGLTGDAIALELEGDRLVAWKPAFGGRLLASITSASPIQMATVRAGVLPVRPPRPGHELPVEELELVPRDRIHILGEGSDDDVHGLLAAGAVLTVGLGVDPADYPLAQTLAGAFGAELAATRKVTDRGWLPRSRQVGITGHCLAPDLAVAVGVSGKLNHMIGLRAARVVVAVNNDPAAPVFDQADLGLVGDWRELALALLALLKRGAVPPTARGERHSGRRGATGRDGPAVSHPGRRAGHG